MTLNEFYASIGGNYEDAISRLMKDSLIERFILMYLQDDSFANLQKAVESGNVSEAFRAAHSLKGVSANLAFAELQNAASELTEQLRPQTEPARQDLVEKVRLAQEKVVAALEIYENSR